MAIRLERFEQRHLDEVVELETELQESPWSRESFTKELDNDRGIFVVATDGERVVAFAACWLIADEAHVINIGVSPDRQRKRLGSRVLTEMLARAKERGAACSTLEVREGNVAAQALYAGFGYEVCGRRKRYYPNNREDALIMWKADLDDL